MKPTMGVVVDGSCEGNPGIGEYRGVGLGDGRVIFKSKRYEDATNNMMEYLAIIHALAMIGKENVVYSDSQTARAWVRDGKCNSGHTTSNRELQNIIDRANEWLREHPEHAKVDVWKTREWGESNADFGKKGWNK